MQTHESVTIDRREASFVQIADDVSVWKRGVRTLRQSRTATVGALIIIFLLLLAAFGPYIAPYDPLEQELVSRHEAPSLSHWLGTDHLGRDILSRILHGARISLSLSLGAVGLGLVLGIPIGLFAGYIGGMFDSLIVGLVDIMLTFPTYLLAIFIVAIAGPSLLNVTLAVGFAILPAMTRVVRGDTLGIKGRELVVASQAIGARPARIVFRHILPNILSSIAVVATLQLGGAILVESSLSFLGLGLSPPTPAWGLMINEGLRYLPINPWIAIVPGLAIMITVLGFNLFGDGLRDALDPHLRGK